jgi:hypothetical protein
LADSVRGERPLVESLVQRHEPRHVSVEAPFRAPDGPRVGRALRELAFAVAATGVVGNQAS